MNLDRENNFLTLVQWRGSQGRTGSPPVSIVSRYQWYSPQTLSHPSTLQGKSSQEARRRPRRSIAPGGIVARRCYLHTTHCLYLSQTARTALRDTPPRLPSPTLRLVSVSRCLVCLQITLSCIRCLVGILHTLPYIHNSLPRLRTATEA